jgi:hypothetical protein
MAGGTATLFGTLSRDHDADPRDCHRGEAGRPQLYLIDSKRICRGLKQGSEEPASICGFGAGLQHEHKHGDCVHATCYVWSLAFDEEGNIVQFPQVGTARCQNHKAAHIERASPCDPLAAFLGTRSDIQPCAGRNSIEPFSERVDRHTQATLASNSRRRKYRMHGAYQPHSTPTLFLLNRNDASAGYWLAIPLTWPCL